MKINGKEVKHIVIRIGENGDDIIYIGEDKIINNSKNLTIKIIDENRNQIASK